MKKLLLAITAVLIAGYAQAFMDVNDTGTSGAAVLKLPAGARASAMGEAFTSVSDDSTAVFWNPAGLNRLTRPSVTLMHALWFDDISYEWASVAVPLGGGRVGLGFKYLSYGSIIETDTTGYSPGSFSPSDMVISGSYAGKIEGLYWGATFKYISLKIKESASAFAGDFGLIQPFRLAGMRVIAGLGVYNVGTGGKFVDETITLPMSVRLGLSLYPVKNLLLSADGAAPSDGALYFGLGTEYKEMIDGELSFAIRAGYNTRFARSGGLTAGLGLSYGGMSLDYAYVPFGNLGETHRISFTMGFGEAEQKAKPAAEAKPEPAMAAPAEAVPVLPPAPAKKEEVTSEKKPVPPVKKTGVKTKPR